MIRRLSQAVAMLWSFGGLVALAVVLVTTALGIVARLVQTNQLSWSFEMLAMSFVWLSVLGVIMAEVRGENVAFDLIDRRLGPRAGHALALLRHLVLVLLGCAIAYSAWKMLQRSAFNPSPVMRLPMWVPHSAILSLGVALAGVHAWMFGTKLRSPE